MIPNDRKRRNNRTNPLKWWFSLLLCIVQLAAPVVEAADITSGYTFASGERNITDTKLNGVITGASINTSFYTDKSAITSPDAADVALLVQNATGLFRKITVGNLTLNNAALISGKTEDTAPATNDFLLSFDTSGATLAKVSFETLSNKYVLSAMTNYATNFMGMAGKADNLVISNSTVSNLMVFADSVILTNGSGAPVTLRNLALTNNMEIAAGANGLDTGSEANNTWYYLWIIWDGTNAATLLSTSLTSPTMPANYTYAARFGAVRNSNSGNIWYFIQRGKQVSVRQFNVVTNVSTTSWTGVSCSNVVPPIASSIQFWGGSTNRGADVYVSAGSDADQTLGVQDFTARSITTTSYGSRGASGFFSVVPTEPAKIYYETGTNPGYYLTISGFTLP